MRKLLRTALTLTALSLCLLPCVSAQPRFEIPLTITDRELSWSMYFGVLPGASYCVVPQDSMNGHYEAEPPPVPPGPLEAFFVWPRTGSNAECFGMGSFNDYRPFISYTQKDTFRVNVYDIMSDPNVVVSWPAGLSAYFNDLILKDVQTGGTLHTVNMLTTTSVDFGSVSNPHFRIYAAGPHNPNDTIAVSVQLQPGWNMVSNPVITANDSVPFLFPVCTGCGWWVPPPWTDNCRLRHGEGRWLKCPTGGTVSITGMPVSVDTIPVNPSWNIIGSLSNPIVTSSVYTIPPNIMRSPFFGFSSGVGYTRADTLRPGSAYWVKLSQAGWIVLSTGL